MRNETVEKLAICRLAGPCHLFSVEFIYVSKDGSNDHPVSELRSQTVGFSVLFDSRAPTSHRVYQQSRKETSMKWFRFALASVIFTLLVVPAVFAEVRAHDQTSVTLCQSRHPGTNSNAILKQELCIQNENVRRLHAWFLQSVQTVLSQVEELRTQVEATSTAQTRNNVRLNEIRLRTAPSSAPVPPSPPVPLPPPPISYVGVPNVVVSAPGQYVAGTFDVPGDRLKIEHMIWGVGRWVRGATAVRVIVKKNGRVIPVVHPDPIRPWNEIYADLDHDGKPERQPYKAFDPLTSDEVNIAMVGPNDKVELIYLVDTGKRVLVPDYPPEILWGDGKRVQYGAVDSMGRWVTDAHGGWPR